MVWTCPQHGADPPPGIQYRRWPDRVGWEHLGSEECSHRDIWEPHSQPKGQVGPGRSGLVRFSGTDGPLHPSPRQGHRQRRLPSILSYEAGLQSRIRPCPRSCPKPCRHLPRSPGLRLSEASFRLDPRSCSFMGLQVWASWLEGRLGWQPWGSREGLRAPGPRSLGPWLRSRPLFSKG